MLAGYTAGNMAVYLLRLL